MEKFEHLWQEVEKLPKYDGVTMADVLDLPEPLSESLKKILRSGSMTVQEFCAELGLSMEQTQRLGKLLVDKGFLHVELNEAGEMGFEIYFARTRGRQLPSNVWNALEEL